MATTAAGGKMVTSQCRTKKPIVIIPIVVLTGLMIFLTKTFASIPKCFEIRKKT
jgi:hypothetical protein